MELIDLRKVVKEKEVDHFQVVGKIVDNTIGTLSFFDETIIEDTKNVDKLIKTNDYDIYVKEVDSSTREGVYKYAFKLR